MSSTYIKKLLKFVFVYLYTYNSTCQTVFSQNREYALKKVFLIFLLLCIYLLHTVKPSLKKNLDFNVFVKNHLNHNLINELYCIIRIVKNVRFKFDSNRRKNH